MRIDGRPEQARLVRTLGVLGACAASVGAAGWYGCSIYDASLLLPADSGPGDDGTGIGDGGGDGAPEAAPNACPEVFPPPAPAHDDPSDAGDQTFVVALHTLDLGIRTDGGKPPDYGYDLDHVYTCCMGGGESCKPPVVGAAHCDEDGGRDNSGGQLLQSFASIAGQALSQDTINQQLQAGQYSLLMQVEHYNGQPNDTQVTAALYASAGIQPTADGAAPPANWDGNDSWRLDSDFVFGNPDASPVLPNHFDSHAYVADGTLVTSIDFPLSLGNESAGTIVISLTGGTVTGRVVPTSSGNFRLAGGQIAGRWNISSLLPALQVVNFNGSYICPGTTTYGSFKTLICRAADIQTDPTQDDKGAACDALSVGFGFTADPALMGAVVTAPLKPNNCAGGAAPDDCTKP